MKISKVDFFVLCGLTFLLVMHLTTESAIDAIHDFRFSWGWVVFYFLFKASIIDRKVLGATLVILSALTVVESALVNTVITVENLPNYPKDVPRVTYGLVKTGVYQTPYSFGGAPQVGGPLLVVLMALCLVQGWKLWLAILAVLACASGTGTIVLAFLLLVKYPGSMGKAIFPLSLTLLVSAFWFLPQAELVWDVVSEKVRWEYITFLIDLLAEVAVSVYEQTAPYEFIFGSSGFGHGGDWGILSFWRMNGFLGVLMFSAMVFTRTNRTNRFPLFLMLTASMHYGAIFFMPGQMIFGLLLSIRERDCPIMQGRDRV